MSGSADAGRYDYEPTCGLKAVGWCLRANLPGGCDGVGVPVEIRNGVELCLPCRAREGDATEA